VSGGGIEAVLMQSADGGPAPPLLVAVTGGIASGKSALTSRFEALGVPVADADLAAREAVAPGSEGLAEVVAAFGPGVLDDAGAMDRVAMRARVFADAEARRRLEAIVHPRVRRLLRAQVAAWWQPYGLLAIPLLAENAAAYADVDRVLVVDVAPEIQVQRLVRRDGVAESLARSILAAQASREARLALADDVHDASGPIEALDARVLELHARYLDLARRKRAGGLPPPKIRALAEGHR